MGVLGKQVFVDLTIEFPQMTNIWYARFMSVVLGTSISASKIARTLEQLRLSRKTGLCVYSESLTDRVYRCQEEFKSDWRRRKERRGQDYLNRCVFLDITGFDSSDFFSKLGISPVGQPFVFSAPSDRASTEFDPHIDVVSGVNRLSGVMGLAVFEGHANAATMLNYFKYILLPELCPGDDVYLDNASYWGGNSETIRIAMRPMFKQAQVNVFYLPPRSPLFNPDEKFNGWLKRAVASDIKEGRANPVEPAAAVAMCVERNEERLRGMCARWIDHIFVGM